MSPYHDLQEECCQANIALSTHRLVDLTFGNASVADPQRGVFAIKPSGADYIHLTPRHIVVLDYEGTVVEGTLRCSSDTPTHRRLLLAFPAIRSVVHTHSRSAVAFAQAGRGIPCLGTTHADYFRGEVPITRPLTPEEISAGYEWETGSVIIERFRGIPPLEIPAVLVHGHGPFTWGENSAKAVENAVALEIVAGLARQTFHLNPIAPPIPQYLLDKHFFRKHGSEAYYGQVATPSSPV